MESLENILLAEADLERGLFMYLRDVRCVAGYVDPLQRGRMISEYRKLSLSHKHPVFCLARG
jgi:hypothetical protein